MVPEDLQDEIEQGGRIFGTDDYYPMPSEEKLSFSKRGSSTLIIKTDISALIVKLTSPMDPIDYPFLSDFFLSYRKFLAPQELLKLLVSRLQWAFNESLSADSNKQQIGQIASVRTFVLIRHWILNYFAQDFLTDDALRSQFVNSVNSLSWGASDVAPKSICGIVINIKKSWGFCLRLMWEGLSFEDQPTSANEWLEFKIKDVATHLSTKNGKRLSFYALQSSQNPEFRNRSVLSLYVGKENFQLPEHNARVNTKQGAKIKQRTASMFLFPQDNLSSAVLKVSNDKVGNSDEVSQNAPNSSGVSEVIKDLQYPPSPSIDKVIPPTPAKKVEFILRSSYFPSEILSEEEANTSSTSQKLKKEPHLHSYNKGMMGLLSKWKKNHTLRSANQKINQESPSAEFENLIKLVFSITSLENKQYSSEELKSVVSSKFDILSARTIDEVEYFLAVENDLLSKIRKQDHFTTVEGGADEQTQERDAETVSAMDNLNLYKTVSSIASSVISLSKTLQFQHAVSPSAAARERRRVRSTDGLLGNKSVLNFTDALLTSDVNTRILENDAPRKLVFHGHSTTRERHTNSELKFRYSNMADAVIRLNHSTPSVMQTSALTKSTNGTRSRGSPTKGVRISSSITEIDDTFSKHNESTPQAEEVSNAGSHISRPLKRKESLDNLREFNFEENFDQKNGSQSKLDHKINHNELQSDADDDNSSFFTTLDDMSMSRNSKHMTPASSAAQKSVTSSGRISIIRSRGPSVSNAVTISTTNLVAKDGAFLKLDEELLNNQEEIRNLEERTSALFFDKVEEEGAKNIRSSIATSVSTQLLFSSKQSSPNKIEKNDLLDNDEFPQGNKLIRLSSIPSMHSIVSGDSFSSFHTINSFEQNSRADISHKLTVDTPSTGAKPEKNAPNDSLLVPDAEGSSGNKYLFSPDTDSLDFASPEKNMEDLKNKFISPITSETTSFNEDDLSRDNEGEEGEPTEEQQLDNGYQEKPHNEHHRRSITPIVSPYKANDSRLNRFAKLTDESLHGDPVNVALMKLEGTFSKTDQNKEQSDSDMERLKERRLTGLGARERNSFLIERRRQVKSEVPFTPCTKDFSYERDQKVTNDQITELLQNYKIQDSRLNISNAEQHVPFILMYDSKSIAEQLTLIEREILNEIDWKDLLDLRVKRKVLPVTSWLQLLLQNEQLSGIDLAIARFNLTVDWIISEIVLTRDNKLRRNTIQRFIHVAEHCKLFQNYNTLMQIVLALSSLVVQSYRDAWRLVEPGDLLSWESLKNVPSLEKNYYNIRMLLNDIEPIKGCIPFIVVYLSDLTLNSEKSNWITPHQVLNYSKFQTNVQIVKNFIQRAQWSKFYNISVNDELLSKCVYISCLTHEEIDHLKSQQTKSAT
ncbi:mitotic regulator LTE1 [Lachancea thermotolerans CBS 6340]|uniref:Guanine nucleotide exchange factor LTE1 n=1 Tax=Lachancea thermotolerans (strain ATCC 56472 / CBS 6340 / NRRL Y-8284) TaxID=559295 RepID=C5DG40_LACTC|nr:KLTH0D02200p [Lachancea thermotolerans CBS 6340]CAR22382.1 KLTH0D02200p [Lachancea thermotolerans CBS 6340]